MGWWLLIFRLVYFCWLYFIVWSSVVFRLVLLFFNYRYGELVWIRVMILYDKVLYYRYLFELFNLKFFDCFIGIIGDLVMDWSDILVFKFCLNFV